MNNRISQFENGDSERSRASSSPLPKFDSQPVRVIAFLLDLVE